MAEQTAGSDTTRLHTGSEMLDLVLGGGLRKGSMVVVAGVPGTGKTILAQQICFHSATPEHKALYYTTLSESHLKLVQHLEPFEFFDEADVGERIDFLHVTDLVGGDGGLSALLSEIVGKSFQTQPSVVVIDSSKVLRDFADQQTFRRTIYELATRISHTDAVLIFVGEYTLDEIEAEPEFAIADAIIRLDNQSNGIVDTRCLQVLKMRGAESITGQHSFKIDARGITVFPRLEKLIAPDAPLPSVGRASTGVRELDEMMGGGLPLGDGTLVLGPSGVGKTVLGLRYLAQGLAEGKRCLYLSLQESEDQLIDKASSFGWDLGRGRDEGLLEIVRIPPVELDLNEVGAILTRELERNSTKVLVLDSLAELAFAARDTERLPGYIWSLLALVRATGASAMITNEVTTMGTIGELTSGLSFLFHNLVQLRYIELEGEVRRAVNVLKMRDSRHAKQVLQFDIDQDGIQVLGELGGLTGILGWSSLRADTGR